MKKRTADKRKIEKPLIVLILIVAAVLIFLFPSLRITEEAHTNAVFDPVIEVNGRFYTNKRDIETILIIGTDTFKQDEEEHIITNGQQADMLLLIVIDKSTGQRTAIHINRDTIADVRVLGIGGKVIRTSPMQLALSHAYGSGGKDSCLNTVRAVSGFLNDITIDHYIALTMDAVAILNDCVGGVEVTVLDDFSAVDETMVKGSKITLTGAQALQYVRARGALDNKTNERRMERQRQYMRAFMDKVSEYSGDEEFMELALKKVADYLYTDMTTDQLQSMMEDENAMKLDEILTIPGELVAGESFAEFYADEAAVSDLVLKLFYKEKL